MKETYSKRSQQIPCEQQQHQEHISPRNVVQDSPISGHNIV
jgi:hypothetical protein